MEVVGEGNPGTAECIRIKYVNIRDGVTDGAGKGSTLIPTRFIPYQ